jgi:hypothetical protein
MTLGPASSEFEGADFNDRRLTTRLGLIADSLADAPQEGAPGALGGGAALEGFYRFVNNERVSPGAILLPHIDGTIERTKGRDRILIIHDTTRMQFNGRGFGPLLGEQKGEGFFAHLALAVQDEVTRAPLGVLAAETFERKRRPTGQRKSLAERATDSELDVWMSLFLDAHSRAASNRAVHVMDRQADAYKLMVGMADSGADFVVRSAHDRIAHLDDGEMRLREAMRETTAVFTRDVAISPRETGGWNAKRHLPSRDARRAELKASAREVTFIRPHTAGDEVSESLTLNVVHVVEKNPPDGETAIEWLLLTTLPIATPEEIAIVIDIYRARWVIEEYFKALKTGCAYEKRQLESPDALLNMLAITIPIAWRLLLLRHLSRNEPGTAAATALPESQLQVLANIARAGLPKNPTVRDAFLSVARLGGHIKNNGEPGWQVLARGYAKLLTLEEGWLAARGETVRRCDQ